MFVRDVALISLPVIGEDIMRSFAKSLILVVGCIAGSAQQCWSDIAPFPVNGAVPLGLPSGEQTHIALVDEKVRMNVAPAVCLVDAVFTLKNPGNTRRLEMGVPYYYPHEVRNLKATVNNIVIPVTDVERQIAGTPPDHPKFQRWKLWTAVFPQGKVSTVHVTYETTPLKDYNNNPNTDSISAWEVQSTVAPDLNPGDGSYKLADATELAEAAAGLSVRCEFSVGDSWKGAAGRGSVEIDYSALKDRTASARPQAGTKEGDKLRWTLPNTQANRTIVARFYKEVARDQRAATYKRVALRRLHDFQFCQQTAETLRALGFKNEAVDVERKSLATWKPADAKVTTFDWGQTEPEYPGALAMAHTLVKSYEELGDATNAGATAQVLARILKGELALVPKSQQRDWGSGWPTDECVALCKKYGAWK
jgi:hypothetical protein